MVIQSTAMRSNYGTDVFVEPGHDLRLRRDAKLVEQHELLALVAHGQQSPHALEHLVLVAHTPAAVGRRPMGAADVHDLANNISGHR